VVELGEGERNAFQEMVDLGRRLMLPADSLGPCFKVGPAAYVRFDLGFDEAATRRSPRHLIADLEAGGPAARAGVRPSDVLVAASYEPGAAGVPVRLDLERDGKPVQVTYAPAGEAVRGLGWTRLRGIPSERCKR
jgi:predicted metalloprotease with PDZ domain